MTECDRYQILLTPAARRQLSGGLPESVAAAVWEFLAGPLALSPERIGKRLQPPLADRFSARRGTYRVLYEIDADTRVVTVLSIAHRRDIYRT